MSDTHDNDPSLDTSQGMSHPAERAARLINSHEGEILTRWIEAVMEKIPGAREKSRAELADHLMEILQDIEHKLQNPAPWAALGDMAKGDRPTQVSSMHGRERATLEGYTIEQLAFETIILRHIMVDFCAQHNVDDYQVFEAINRIIENASLIAVSAFAKSMREIRTKLVSTLVHDVRTPLSVACNYVELLALTELPHDKKQQATDTISKNIRRVTIMLEELLDATRIEAGHGLYMRFCESDINEAIKTVCAEAAQVYSTPITSSLADHSVLGIFDLGLIVRTAENLISNAVKFGYQDTPIGVSLSDEGDRVRILVHNQGEPIPQSDMNTIFEFFSSPASGNRTSKKGWGLGLSLIKTVAKCHGGEVIFESTSDKGSTFGMVLSKTYKKDGEELSILL